MMTRHAFDSVQVLQQLPGLLMQLLPAIDINDLIKTSQALVFYNLFLNHVPIFELADGPEALAIPEGMSEDMAEARLGVVSILTDWSFLFLDRILELVSNSAFFFPCDFFPM